MSKPAGRPQVVVRVHDACFTSGEQGAEGARKFPDGPRTTDARAQPLLCGHNVVCSAT